MKKFIKKNFPNLFFFLKKIKNFLVFLLYFLPFKLKILNKSLKKRDLKLVIGSAGIKNAGWLNSNIELIDLTNFNSFKFFFSANSINRILCEHVFEHLTLDDALISAKNIYHFLKPNGFIRVAVPDGFHPDPDYINWVRPNGVGDGADDHKILYNYLTIAKVFKDSGFKVRFLEYFDEKGFFHYNQWNPEDGFVLRSRNYDNRNIDGKINYSSIIIDAIKI